MLFSYINCFSSCQSGIVNNKYSILIVNRVKVSINTVYDILSIYGEGVMDLRLKIVKAKDGFHAKALRALPGLEGAEDKRGRERKTKRIN